VNTRYEENENIVQSSNCASAAMCLDFEAFLIIVTDRL